MLINSLFFPFLIKHQKKKKKKEHIEKIAIYEQEKGPSPNLESAGTLIVDLPASRIVRNKHCFFKPPGLHLGITGLVPKAQS